MKFSFPTIISVLLISASFSACNRATDNEEPKSGSGTVTDFDAVISTEYGDIKIKLFEDAPRHKAQFLKLANEGFYDGTTFHRVLQDFMIQGGDPFSKDPSLGTPGNGGNDHPVTAEISSTRLHSRGIISAARLPDQINPERISGTQFFIVTGKKMDKSQIDMFEGQLQIVRGSDFRYTDEQRKMYKEKGGAPWLDFQYSIFGEVVEGMDVVDKITAQPKSESGAPSNPVTMKVKVK